MASDDELYPPGPREVPASLTAPTGAYARSAWLAFGGLLAFVALYVGLTVHLGWVIYRLLRGAIEGANIVAALLALPPAFFFAFLVRGLFVVKQHQDESLVEVTAKSEPALLAFVRRIADETGAPRPHRVFLSARVNAAVFYDLSFFNLLFPTRKNLEIGLGLVNALSLDELKAVIAHEFGHFAQRTMAVGRWVYIAQQIAGHIIVSRGIFDRFLAAISRIDIRIAWIGWGMRLLVWAIRAVLDTFFRVVVLAHRALSREMELSADLVAVSVTGSDSLIHALHRLGPADDAWERAANIALDELAKGQAVADLFTLQSRVLEHLRRIFDEEDLGATPARSDDAAHRVFETALAQPPRMWSTHPPNREREDNAKARYLPSALDPRPAWALFADPERTRREVTQRFFEMVTKEAVPGPVPIEVSLASLDERFERVSLDRRYRGVYLGRSPVAAVAEVDDLYDPIGDVDRESVLERIDALYPESLAGDLERWRELCAEHAQLVALKDGVLSAPGGVIRHRGREIPRRDLAQVIDSVKREKTAADEHVLAHDRAVRTAHRMAARLRGDDWEEYLVSLTTLQHYADHASAEVADAHGYMKHVLRIVTADGRVTSGERQRLLSACRDVFGAIEAVFAQRASIELPQAVRKKLGHERFDQVLSDAFTLSPPSDQNLPSWLDVIDSWAGAAINTTGALTRAALEALLETEDRLAKALREGTELGPAPPPAKVPGQYATLALGEERERQKRLGSWDRFQLADGFLPGLARFVVASGLLVPALLLSAGAGEATVTVLNGLAIPVAVSIEGEGTTVPPRSSAVLHPTATAGAHVVTTTLDGREVERFEVDADSTWADYVYDVAGAAPLVEWTAVYGSTREVPNRELGAPRWLVSRADVLFRDPPTSVSTSRGSDATRDVLTAVTDAPPPAQVSLVRDPAERNALVMAHARFDPSTDPALRLWVAALEDPLSVIRERLADAPRDVFWLRIEQDTGDRAEVCARQRELAGASDDLAYIVARCLPDRAARGRAYLEGHARHPDDPWFAMGAGYEHAARGEWQLALDAFEARRAPALAALRVGVSVDVARVRRVMASSPLTVSYTDLTRDSGLLEALLRIEGVGRADPALDAEVWPWKLLARGELSAAVSASDPSTLSMITRLAAASEGATPDLSARAWSLPAEHGIDGSTVWSTIALALREGRDAGPWLEQARTIFGDDADPLVALVESGRIADASAIESVLNELLPALRGQAMVMGIIALGDDAPAEWRRLVKALLFVPERPYFR